MKCSATTTVAALLLIVALGFTPSRAIAQSQPPTSSTTGESIVAIEENERAPFSGMLFPTDTAVSWRQRLALLQEQLTLDVQRCEDTAQLRLQLSEGVLSAERSRASSDVSSLRAALEESQRALHAAQERGWWESPPLWFGIGVVVTVIATVAIAVSVH